MLGLDEVMKPLNAGLGLEGFDCVAWQFTVISHVDGDCLGFYICIVK